MSGGQERRTIDNIYLELGPMDWVSLSYVSYGVRSCSRSAGPARGGAPTDRFTSNREAPCAKDEHRTTSGPQQSADLNNIRHRECRILDNLNRASQPAIASRAYAQRPQQYAPSVTPSLLVSGSYRDRLSFLSRLRCMERKVSFGG